MDIESISTVDFLIQRKRLFQDEINKIDKALAVMQEPTTDSRQRRSKQNEVQWSDKVDEVFENFEGDLAFTQVCKKLVEIGVPEAAKISYKASINACLSRKVSQGKLERPRKGIYRKRKELVRMIRTKPMIERKEEPSSHEFKDI